MKKRCEFGTATVVNERKINFDSAIEAANICRRVRRQKYNAKKTTVDGITFDSQREADHCRVLKLREKVGEIADLQLQVRYELRVNGLLITTYRADFTFIENGKLVVQDVKGVKTRSYKIAKLLMKAIHDIDIEEVF